MTITEMRAVLGLADSVSDAAVVAAYAASLNNSLPDDPDLLPVTLEEAKRQLRITPGNTTRDVEIVGIIGDAVRWVEKESGHLLFARTVQQTFAAFDRFALLAWPVAPDAVPTVSYVTDGDRVAITTARVGYRGRTAIVLPPEGAVWPTSDDTGVIVAIRAGYEPGAGIPGTLRRAVLVLVSGFDEGGKALLEAEAAARSLCGLERAGAL